MFKYSLFKKKIKECGLQDYILEKHFNDLNVSIFHYIKYPHNNIWNNLFLRESRGISFKGEALLSRPFHKFFNINETKETEFNKIFGVDDEFIFFDKIDGSLIIVEKKSNNTLCCRTKKSYTNIQSKLANQILRQKNIKDKLINIINNNWTPLFELVSPYCPIVIKYNTTKLYFLALRHNITGEYIFENPFSDEIESVNCYRFSSKVKAIEYIDRLGECENIEGIVGFSLKRKIMFKYKTKWYLERHRAKNFLTSPKQFVELFIDDKLDDVFSLLTNEHDIQIAKKIEKICFEQYTTLIKKMNNILEKDSNLNRKEFALKYSNKPYFGLLIRLFTGSTVDIKKYFMKHIYPTVRDEINKIIKGEEYV